LFGGYGLALAALALVVFGAIECPPIWNECYNLLIMLASLKYKINFEIRKEKKQKKTRGVFMLGFSKFA